MAGISGTGFNFGSIGNVGLYAKQLVKSYSARAAAQANKSDSYTSVISKTVGNNQKFVTTNAANLKSLKTTASSLERAARGLSGSAGSEDLVKAAENFASSYNRTIQHLTTGGADGAGVERALGYVTDNRLTASSAARYGGYAASRLADMGISIDEDGAMQIDAEKLQKAAADNPNGVRNMLTGYNSIADVTQRNADRAMRVPAATYTDFSRMQARDSLLDAMLPQVGGLFDIFA